VNEDRKEGKQASAGKRARSGYVTYEEVAMASGWRGSMLYWVGTDSEIGMIEGPGVLSSLIGGMIRSKGGGARDRRDAGEWGEEVL
jgi:hypothetical protein